ncbi:MAG TPA: type II toxin-antitoxin system RelE/ParE family toxin [Polyangiaceae bacterium]|nr:type II toxin-antitoxin system RelE/ParE family toxin [Polyangiaceae bacterium]
MTVRLTDEARRELAAQVAYLASVNPDAARRLAAAVRGALKLLDGGKVDGPQVQLKDGPRVRRWLVSPLQLFDERDGNDVVVRRVRHESQRPITRR